jgi:uncharacterized protein (TIGR03435 family)
MIKPLACAGSILLICGAASGQLADNAPKPEGGAKFEVAGVRPSANTRNSGFRSNAPRGGRYEIKFATMVDLIRTAYNMGGDRIVGGPSWLELDRFDVVAKLPAEATVEERRQMLQTLLTERFKLVLHNDTRPLPVYALTVGKKLALKEADGQGDSGCKPEVASGPPVEGGIRLTTNGPTGAQTTLNLGPGGSIHMICHNMTMAAFATSIRGMIGAPDLGSGPVLDETELKGTWNFDLRYSLQMFGPMMGNDAERVSMTAGIEKLGLKLEKKQVPTPVLVVDSVNRKPSADLPEVAEVLPPLATPTEFEVADIKQTDPNIRGGRFNFQPGGRLTVQAMNLRFLVMRAFNVTGNQEEIAGLPAFADSERYDITAKAPSMGGQAPNIDFESSAPMMRALLVDRFKMTYHTEPRKVSAYSLIAPKSKLKKADPDARSSCKQINNAPGAPAGSTMLSCQNVTMAYFADRLQNLSFGSIHWPVEDATELEGGYDISLTFSPSAGMNFGPGPGRGGNSTENAVPTASDPTGGVTIFDAIEKLGLKLEQRKREMPVIVIDHIEQKPTEN